MENDELYECINCEEWFDIDIMELDDDNNRFCPECWKVLSPIMKQDYEEFLKEEKEYFENYDKN